MKSHLRARIVYIHPETGTRFESGWMGRSRIASFWRWLASHGVTDAHTELR